MRGRRRVVAMSITGWRPRWMVVRQRGAARLRACVSWSRDPGSRLWVALGASLLVAAGLVVGAGVRLCLRG